MLDRWKRKTQTPYLELGWRLHLEMGSSLERCHGRKIKAAEETFKVLISVRKTHIFTPFPLKSNNGIFSLPHTFNIYLSCHFCRRLPSFLKHFYAFLVLFFPLSSFPITFLPNFLIHSFLERFPYFSYFFTYTAPSPPDDFVDNPLPPIKGGCIFQCAWCTCTIYSSMFTPRKDQKTKLHVFGDRQSCRTGKRWNQIKNLLPSPFVLLLFSGE